MTHDPHASARRRAADTLIQTLNRWHEGLETAPRTAIRHGETVCVQGEGGAETFTLSSDASGEHFITGRGGRYPLDWRGTAVALAVSVTGAASRVPLPIHALAAPLAAHGFALEQAETPKRFKGDFWINTLHARHPDGRVVWFEDCDHVPYRDEQAITTLDCGIHLLSAFYLPASEETLALCAEAFDAAPERGPDPVWAYHWPTEPRTLAALLRDPGHAEPLPGERPVRFFRDLSLPGIQRRDVFPDHLRGRAATRREAAARGENHTAF